MMCTDGITDHEKYKTVSIHIKQYLERICTINLSRSAESGYSTRQIQSRIINNREQVKRNNWDYNNGRTSD